MAFQHALGRQGVAVVSMSGDTAEQETELRQLLPHSFQLEPSAYAPSDSDLAAAARLIDGHRKVTMYCGAGVRDAHAEVLALAGRLKAPVGYTLRGKEWIEHDNPYAVGLTGLIGFGGCTKALEDADLLLLVGTDFPYREFIPEGKTIIQIDSRPEHLGRRARLDCGLAGDAARTLRGLVDRVAEKNDDAHLRAAQKVQEEAQRKLDIYAAAITRALAHSGPALVSIAPPDWLPGCRCVRVAAGHGLRQGHRQARLARSRRPDGRPGQGGHPRRRPAARDLRASGHDLGRRARRARSAARPDTLAERKAPRAPCRRRRP